MRFVPGPLLGLPLLIVALAGTVALHQPADHAGAYGSDGSAVYTAQVVGALAEQPKPVMTIHPRMETASLPREVSALPIRAVRSAMTPAAGFAVQGPPSISPAQINRVLTEYGSPMAGEGMQLYRLGVKYGIDPAFCLAFFVQESSAGTRGEAVLTHNLGNIRASGGAPAMDGYRYYNTWLEGAEDWYSLISNVYVRQWGLTTVDSILPVYAPSSDNNDPTAYMTGVERLVSTWRAQS